MTKKIIINVLFFIILYAPVAYLWVKFNSKDTCESCASGSDQYWGKIITDEQPFRMNDKIYQCKGFYER